jgi:hypothetical protein
VRLYHPLLLCGREACIAKLLSAIFIYYHLCEKPKQIECARNSTGQFSLHLTYTTCSLFARISENVKMLFFEVQENEAVIIHQKSPDTLHKTPNRQSSNLQSLPRHVLRLFQASPPPRLASPPPSQVLHSSHLFQVSQPLQ